MPVEQIKKLLPSIPNNSGVYKFLDSEQQVLYVGKAKNLAKRVAQYTNFNALSVRIKRMVTLAYSIETTITASEFEALLLECNLIKKLLPPFNILLKDGKTFAQIAISHHNFAQISLYRGAKTSDKTCFGPFTDTASVKKTISILRKIFLLRSCKDSEYETRLKPCLDYQIKKCSAPCVGKISQDDYQHSVKNTLLVLAGKSKQVQELLLAKMQQYSDNLQYEKAILVREQIKSLDLIQHKQHINVHFAGDFDLINVIVAGDQLCCYVACYRAGQNYGAKPYFFAADEDLADCLEQFLGRFYWQNTPPALILCNINLHNQQLMSDLLSSIAKHKVTIEVPKRGDKYQLMQQQYQLGLQVLEQKISQNMTTKALLLDLKKTFALTKIPQRIEVYDNSHTQFSQPVGAMIVAGLDGFIKSAYRKFYIKENAEMLAIASNKDDTAMLKQVLYRRFSNKQLALPDLLLIDGGKPQLQAVVSILQQLHLDLSIICMAKGEKRNSGEESYYTAQQLQGMQLPKSSPLAYYLQRLRDEAHRFAISNHRLRRAKAMFSNGD